MRSISKWIAAGLVAASLLSGCTGSDDELAFVGDKPLQGALEMSVSPQDGAADVAVDTPVEVSATNGRLMSVSVSSESSPTPLEGVYSRDLSTWKAQSALGGGDVYTLTYEVEDSTGDIQTQTTTFSTQEPKGRMKATFSPGQEAVVGVAMPIVVNFNQDVVNREAVQRALKVRTMPATEGAWGWTAKRQMMWRPRNFWTPETQVSVSGNLRAVEFAPGVFGEKDVNLNFSIGRNQESIVDIANHTLTVKRNGKIINELPITTGKKGYETRNGIKVIMTHERTHQMDAATLGTSKDDPEYYNITAHYSMRITYSGEFLHAAPWSAGSHGRANVSHGCTGLNMARAQWMFENSIIGDPVTFINGNRELEPGNGYTMWNTPYSAWTSVGI